MFPSFQVLYSDIRLLVALFSLYMQVLKNNKNNTGDKFMDLDKFTIDVCQKLKMFKYIYQKKEFLARELFEKFEIPDTSGYRDLGIWVDKQLLEKPENGNGTKYNVKYKTTPAWTNFYEDLCKKILDILLYD